MPYDSDFREADITAVDTMTALTAKGADTPGGFQVPANASRITEVRITSAADWTADAMYAYACGVHLYGSGLRGSDQWFAGPAGGTCGAAATSAGVQAEGPAVYLCNIPVNGGNVINAAGFMGGEDVGAIHVAVQLIYDGPVSGPCSKFDLREESLTAANTPVTLGQRGDTAEGDVKPQGTIGELHIVAGLKGVAGPLRAPTSIKLSGAGLAIAGTYEFLGPAFATQDDIAISGKGFTVLPIKTLTNIPTKSGNDIRVQGQMIEDDVGTVFMMVCFGYV